MIEQLHQLEEQIQTLQAKANDAGREPLLPPDVDLTDGRITVQDAEGNVVGTYKITTGDVALALGALELEPEGVRDDGDPPATEEP